MLLKEAVAEILVVLHPQTDQVSRTRCILLPILHARPITVAFEMSDEASMQYLGGRPCEGLAAVAVRPTLAMGSWRFRGWMATFR